jgi:hypothetical protein
VSARPSQNCLKLNPLFKTVGALKSTIWPPHPHRAPQAVHAGVVERMAARARDAVVVCKALVVKQQLPQRGLAGIDRDRQGQGRQRLAGYRDDHRLGGQRSLRAQRGPSRPQLPCDDRDQAQRKS